ncbi:hypothetical protein QFA92_000887 [Salmonella enterica]|nr:hypothetical protein [Salmonella enterica]EKY7348541.1 hypothetical protein [Salmonella enterica]ELN1909648.1 hypothetical protein [Salmonella enterica]
MILQQNIVHGDVSIPLPALNIELFISPDFTGRVVLYIENGRVICDRQLLDDEHVCSLDSFIEIAREAGIRFEEISNVGYHQHCV